MSDNFTTKDASNQEVTLATSEDSGSVHSSKQVSYTGSTNTTLTRPANTTAYAANDAVTDDTSSPSAITLANVARINGGHATIMDAMLRLSNPNATLVNFEVWLFNTAPTIPNDNAAFAFSDAELLTVEAVLKFYASDYSDSSNNRLYHMANPPRLVKCASGTTSLYAVIKTLNAFTPVSAETFNLLLKLVQDI